MTLLSDEALKLSAVMRFCLRNHLAGQSVTTTVLLDGSQSCPKSTAMNRVDQHTGQVDNIREAFSLMVVCLTKSGNLREVPHHPIPTHRVVEGQHVLSLIGGNMVASSHCARLSLDNKQNSCS